MKTSITIACGGTGGHIHPAIAVADKLRAKNHTLSLILSGTRDAECKTAETWQGPLLCSGARPMRHLFANALAILRCVRFLKQQRPAVLFATGGYTSFPPVIAARLCRIPVVFHEANSLTGAAIRFCTKLCNIATVATSFPETTAQLPHVKTVYTGLPLRQNVLDTLAKARAIEKTTDTFSIFVTGGSQGAHGMNLLIAPGLATLAKNNPHVRILHQCGKHDIEYLQGIYDGLSNQISVVPFVDDMGTAYGQADLIVARAGAATCFEIARCAVPTIFIPLPTAADDHQRKNAEALVKCGGAICVDQHTTTPEQFTETLQTLTADVVKRQQMQAAFAAIPQTDAAQAVADILLNIASLHA